MSSPANDRRFRPNLASVAHPDVDRAMRNAYDALYDMQDGVSTLVGQLLGGAMGIASVAAGVVSIQMTSGGYYHAAPVVKLVTNGTGYSATAILTGNRVSGVTIKQGTGATTASVTFLP